MLNTRNLIKEVNERLKEQGKHVLVISKNSNVFCLLSVLVDEINKVRSEIKKERGKN